MQDEMQTIVKCKHCNMSEYYGKMTWLNGKSLCRACYKEEYKDYYKKLYAFKDKDFTPEEAKELERQ